MLRFEAHTNNILALIKEDLSALTSNDTPDMIVICKDDEIVQTQKNLLCMFSSTLRTMLGSVLNMETFMVFMPDFKKSTVQKVIRMLKFEWREDELWDSEVVQLLQGLNMNVGHFQEKKRIENAVIAPIATSPSMQGHEVHVPLLHHQEIEQVESMPSMNTQKASPNSISVRKKYGKRDVRCPNCSRIFSGTQGRVRDMLRNHLGNMHFQSELSIEVKNYFGNGSKCNACNKIIQNPSMKKKHLIFNHSKIVNVILSIVNNVEDDDEGLNPNEEVSTNPTLPLNGEEEEVKAFNNIEKTGTENYQSEVNKSVLSVLKNEDTDELENNHGARKQHEKYDDDVDSLLQSDDEKETDEIQKFLLADVSDDDDSDEEDSDAEDTGENVLANEEQEKSLEDGPQDTQLADIDIQNQLLRDQDLSDSDEEASTDDLEQEEVDNISYEEPGSEKDSMDDGMQDDAELIQRNLLQDQDISDDDDDDY